MNAAAPETPVFILHLYDRALLNAAALRAAGYTKDTPEPPGGQIERDARGNPTGLLVAKPNATILYATLAKGPKLAHDDQVNSTLLFMRELNRLGITSAIDAGGGFQNYPDDYAVIADLAKRGELTVRIAYNLFTQRPQHELDDFTKWTSMTAAGNAPGRADRVSAEDVACGFRSGEHALDDYFRRHALPNDAGGIGRAYVIRRGLEGASELPAVLGYYTLSMAVVTAAAVERPIGRKLPKYPMPVALIGRLAVDERARGRRVGEALLVDATDAIVAVDAIAGAPHLA